MVVVVVDTEEVIEEEVTHISHIVQGEGRYILFSSAIFHSRCLLQGTRSGSLVISRCVSLATLQMFQKLQPWSAFRLSCAQCYV